jgi:hypothetical protein
MRGNQLKDLKHRDAGFFIWIYYPLSRHNLINISPLFNELFSGIQSLTSESRINLFLEEGQLDILKRQYDIYIVGTSAFPNGKESWGVQFDRDGMASILIMDYNSRIHHDRHDSVCAWLKDIDTICQHLHPVYGHGHIQFNNWIDLYPILPSPETRIWPYNLFNLTHYPPQLMTRLDHFMKDNSEDWSLRRIGESVVELRTRDLRTKESEIDPDVTRAILGEGDDLLTPNVGYPPPERWWD